MKPLDYLFYNMVSMLCIGGAIYLMAANANGWGWLLIIGALTTVVPHKFSGSDNK